MRSWSTIPATGKSSLEKKVGEKAQLDKRSPRISPIKRTGGLTSKGGVIWRQFLGLLYAETKVSDCL